MRSEKGISLLALIITIIVIVILAGISFYNSKDSVKIANKAKIEAEKSEILEATSMRFSEYSRNEVAYPLVGRKDSIANIVDYIVKIQKNETSQEPDRSSIETTVTNHIDYIRIVDSAYMFELGVEKISPSNSYIVDYYSAKVYGPIIVE